MTARELKVVGVGMDVSSSKRSLAVQHMCWRGWPASIGWAQ
jgi:hypothetical protein